VTIYAQDAGQRAPIVHLHLAANGKHHTGLLISRKEPVPEDEAELLFQVGRALAFVREDFVVCTVVESAKDLLELGHVLAHVVRPGSLPAPVGPIAGFSAAEATRRLARHLADTDTRVLAQRLLPVASPRLGLTAWAEWLDAVTETSVRVGLLLGGDLLAAREVIARDEARSRPGGEVPALRPEVLRFYTSDDYVALRRELTG
jgi:hypothetical protein